MPIQIQHSENDDLFEHAASIEWNGALFQNPRNAIHEIQITYSVQSSVHQTWNMARGRIGKQTRLIVFILPMIKCCTRRLTIVARQKFARLEVQIKRDIVIVTYRHVPRGMITKINQQITKCKQSRKRMQWELFESTNGPRIRALVQCMHTNTQIRNMQLSNNSDCGVCFHSKQCNQWATTTTTTTI